MYPAPAFSPTLDGFIGLLIFLKFLGIAFIVIGALFVLVTLIEAFILWQYKYGSLPASLLASLTMNVASTVIGFGLACFLNTVITELALTRELPIEPSGGTPIVLLLICLAFYWLQSVICEGGVLRLMRRDFTYQRIWQMSLATNLISYAFLGLATGVIFTFSQ